MCFAGVKQLPRFFLFPLKKRGRGARGGVRSKAWCIPLSEPRPATLCYTFGYLQEEKRGGKKGGTLRMLACSVHSEVPETSPRRTVTCRRRGTPGIAYCPSPHVAPVESGPHGRNRLFLETAADVEDAQLQVQRSFGRWECQF